MRKQLFMIGDAAKHTGVSVRTLHYYDEKGILKPSHRSDSGYRMYSLNDLMQLQRIKSMQQLGLSLVEIEAALGDANYSMLQTLQDHLAFLRKRIKQKERVAASLERLIASVSDEQEPTFEMLSDALKETVMYQNYFSQQSLQKATNLNDDEYYGRIEESWKEILGTLKKEMEAGHGHDTRASHIAALRALGLMKDLMETDSKFKGCIKNANTVEGCTAFLSLFDLTVSEELVKFYLAAMAELEGEFA